MKPAWGGTGEGGEGETCVMKGRVARCDKCSSGSWFITAAEQQNRRPSGLLGCVKDLTIQEEEEMFWSQTSTGVFPEPYVQVLLGCEEAARVCPAGSCSVGPKRCCRLFCATVQADGWGALAGSPLVTTLKDACQHPKTATFQTPLWPRPKSCLRTPQTKTCRPAPGWKTEPVIGSHLGEKFLQNGGRPDDVERSLWLLDGDLWPGQLRPALLCIFCFFGNVVVFLDSVVCRVAVGTKSHGLIVIQKQKPNCHLHVWRILMKHRSDLVMTFFTFWSRVCEGVCPCVCVILFKDLNVT